MPLQHVFVELDVEILVFALTFIAAAFLGLTVYLRNPKSATHQLFFALTTLVGVYTVIHFLSLHPPLPTAESQLLWVRIDMAVGAFFGPILFFLVHTFPHARFTLARKYFLAISALGLITAALSLSSLVFSSIEYPNGTPIPVPGPGIVLYFVDFVGLILGSFLILALKYRTSVGIEKTKLLYLLLGIVASFSLMAVTTLVFVVLFQTSAVVFLGPVSTLILASFIAYAIIKHQFLDIKPVIARAVSFVLLVFFVASLYAFALLFATNKIIGAHIETSVFVTILFLTLISIFTFHPLENLLRKYTARFFYKEHYDGEKLLSHVTRIMVDTTDVVAMTKGALKTITNTMHITSGALAGLDGRTITDSYFVGNSLPPTESSLHALIKLVRSHAKHHHFIVFEHLEESVLKELFRELDIAVVFLVRVEKEKSVVLIFGPKASGEAYTTLDIKLLEIISFETAVAFERARWYAEVKAYSRELEKRVQQRTDEIQKLRKREHQIMVDISHNLQTPLTIIKSGLGFLKKHIHDEKRIAAFEKSVDETSKIIYDLLNLARLEAGTYKEQRGKVCLSDLLKEVLEYLEILAHEKKIVLKGFVEDNITVLGSPKELEELIVNLVSNAMKYMGKQDKKKITLVLSRTNGMAALTVADTGTGIAAENLAHIFERFYRIRGNEEDETLSSGLGLAISKKIVEQHGGTITAKSEFGEGSVFTVQLPIAPA